MNEITVVTMSWWQVALFTMVIFFYGYLLNMLMPLIERKLKEVERRLKEEDKRQKGGVVPQGDMPIVPIQGTVIPKELNEKIDKLFEEYRKKQKIGAPRQKPKPKPRNKGGER